MKNLHQYDVELTYVFNNEVKSITLQPAQPSADTELMWECDILEPTRLYSYLLFFHSERWTLRVNILPTFGDEPVIVCSLPNDVDIVDDKNSKKYVWSSNSVDFYILDVELTKRRFTMAKLIDDVEVKLGRAIRVCNLNPKRGESNTYIAIQVEDLDSKNERCILFTEYELSLCPILDITWDLVPGRLYPYSDNQYTGYIVKTLTYSQKRDEWYVVVRRITKKRLETADQRAIKNPEDLTRKSWLVDWLD